MKRVIIIFSAFMIIASVFASPRKRSLGLPDTVMWLKCDAVEENQIKDVSGMDNHAEVHSIAGGDLKGIGSTRAIKLKGDSYLSVPSSESLQLARKDYTIALWVKPDSVDEKDMSLFTKKASAKEKEYDFVLLQGGRMSVEMISGGNKGTVTNQSSIKAGEWTHLVITASADKIKKGSADAVQIYADRRKMSTGGVIRKLPDDSNAEIRIGQGYKGLIDDIRIFDSELSSREVSILWRNAPSIEMRR